MTGRRPLFEPQTFRDKRVEREGAAAIRRELAKHYPDLETADLPDSVLMAARGDPRVRNIVAEDPRWPELMKAALSLPAASSRWGGTHELRLGGHG